ncbi:hypothetical protein [Roseateles sp.]|uniref:hypothetical protein n=1 Tax=Roseateles sp. TaxID=1971397 RepID=UPI003BA7FD8E
MSLIFQNTVSELDDLQAPEETQRLTREPSLEEVRIAIEMSRVLARAGLTALESDQSQEGQLMEWAMDYQRQDQAGRVLSEVDSGMTLRRLDDLHRYAFKRARIARWNSYGTIVSPGGTTLERRIARVVEGQRYYRLGAGFGMPAPVDLELLEIEVSRHLCCEVLKKLSKNQELKTAGVTLRITGGNYAEVIYEGIPLLFVCITPDERAVPKVAFKVVMDALSREVSNYLCDDSLIVKAIEALQVQQESEQGRSLRRPLRSVADVVAANQPFNL